MFGLVKKKQMPTVPAPAREAPQALRNEILEDARRQAQKLQTRVQKECDQIMAHARTEAEATARQIIATAEANAAKQSAIKLSILPVEAGRYRGAHIERQLAAIRTAATAKMRAAWQGAAVVPKVLALAAEAMTAMTGESFTLHLSPSDHQLLSAETQWLTALRTRTAKAALQVVLKDDLTAEACGVVVRSATGKQQWDGRLTARLERVWPQLRIMVAKELGLLE